MTQPGHRAEGRAPTAARSAAAPLGVFDSGLGGLTVVRALRARLPGESIIYLGDTARVPYGTRSAETVVRYARSCASVLIEQGIKGLVIACNTASAVAVDLLRAELDLPVLGVIVPGAHAAVALAERTSLQEGRATVIGVLSTQGTLNSGAYPRAVASLSSRFEVLVQAAPLLVPLVEEGWLAGQVPELAIARYVEPLVRAQVGAIVLGCTHYPLLRGPIARIVAEMAGREIPIVDSGEATADAVALLVDEGRLAARAGGGPGELQLLVTDLPSSFDAAARRFLAAHVPSVTQVDLPIDAGR